MAIRSRMLGRHTVTTPQPMSELNLTPLIDVLLVLLVMLILSIPIATHKVEVDLPGPSIAASEKESIFLSVSQEDRLFWNGTPVTARELDARLLAVANLADGPTVKFAPDANASYEASVNVIHAAGDAGVGSFAFVGNEQHRNFSID